MRNGRFVAGILGVTLLGGTVALALTQDPGGEGGGDASGAALVRGLQATPGCLGVETGRFSSGKQSIVAWFKDKQSVLRWYHSDTHEGVMRGVMPGVDRGKPMEHVPDDIGPIMVIATLTPSDAPQLAGVQMPISQISIEMFKPLPGGAHIGGRLSPEAFEVPHMQDYTDDAG